MANLIMGGITGLTLLSRVYEAGLSLWNDYHNPQLDTDERIRHIALNTGFIVAQVGAIGTDVFAAPPHIRIGAHLVAGGVDVFRTGYLMNAEPTCEDYLKVAAIALLRIGQTVNITCIASPDLFGDNVELIKELSQFVTCISSCFLDLTHSYQFVKGLFVSINPKPAEVVKRIESVLKKCPISQQLINRIKVVKGTANAHRPIYYDEASITNWLANNPLVLPPNWPADIPLSPDSLEDCLWLQNRIDKENQARQSDFFFSKAKDLRIYDVNISSKNITDNIIINLPINAITVISVSILLHTFDIEDAVEKKSRQIEFKTRYTIAPSKPLNDCIPSAKAVLGSSEDEDKNSLQELINNKFNLTLWFSLDQNYYHIQVN